MTKYIPIFKIDGEMQFRIYTEPVPKEHEWRLLRSIIDNNADFICSKKGDGTPIKVYSIYKTERSNLYLRWDIVMRFDETDAGKLPSPFDEWMTGDELWGDDGRFVGSLDETREKLEKAYMDSLRGMVGDDFDFIEVSISVINVWPYLRMQRVKEQG